jgi:cytochrome c-type biogenesis protein CcmH
MIFWVLAAALAAGAVLAIVRPLARAPEAAPALEHDLAVYRDQLAEIDRDRARGLIDDAQAEAARTEIKRRMLAADRRARRAAAATRRRPARRLAAGLVVLLPLLALAVYLPLGAPNLPARPFAERDPAERERLQALQEDTETLARELADRPDDLDGWVALGRRYTALGRHEQAVEAYARAVGLSGGDPAVVGAYGEALVDAAGGSVTEQALAAFEQVVEADPADPRARYYLGLARAQAGDDRGALERWQALAADSPPNAPWMPLLEQRLAGLAQRLGVDLAEIMPPPAAPAGPTAEDLEAARAMSEEDRAAMVRGMVESLAARLDDNPGDLEGWVRLGRSYMVLGETARAAEALGRAAALAPDSRAIQHAYLDAMAAATGSGPLPEAIVAVAAGLLERDGTDVRALWFLGLDAARDGRAADAERYWSRLIDQLPPDSPEREAIRRRIEALPAG